jgi:hypothetical protein
VNGEDLIGEFVEETSDGIVIMNVGSVALVPTKTGVGMSIYPFAPYAAESYFTFKQQHIVTQFEPGTDLLNNYNKIFGSGIQIASAGILNT